jgi:preprotein translocase subunit SecG
VLRSIDSNGSIRFSTRTQHSVDIAINLVMIIISAVLIFIILLQTKGSSFSGAFGGGSDSIQRTRRGFEKTLFQFTIGIATFFVVVAVISSLALG